MQKFEVYKSEGGYRFADDVIHGGPVITRDTPWYTTRRAAARAAQFTKEKFIAENNLPFDKTAKWADIEQYLWAQHCNIVYGE